MLQKIEKYKLFFCILLKRITKLDKGKWDFTILIYSKSRKKWLVKLL